MFRRKVFALSLVLILCLGTGTAFAIDENPPSEHLLQMTERANETVAKMSEAAATAGEKLEEAYNNGWMSYESADKVMQVLCSTLEKTSSIVYAPVLAQCQRENVSWTCVYVEVEIGWRTALVDPIYVPGNSD